MSDIICEALAHRAGFIVSVGNWITPDGKLLNGTDYESHHWETLIKHIGHIPDADNNLSYMNSKIEEGYIRLVFRADVLFQVCGQSKDELWDDLPYFKKMMEILKKLNDVEIHIFSRKFYVIGTACNIANHRLELLQIKEMK